jgi:hypothetical protein
LRNASVYWMLYNYWRDTSLSEYILCYIVFSI